MMPLIIAPIAELAMPTLLVRIVATLSGETKAKRPIRSSDQ
jgi:hypothetical protein